MPAIPEELCLCYLCYLMMPITVSSSVTCSYQGWIMRLNGLYIHLAVGLSLSQGKRHQRGVSSTGRVWPDGRANHSGSSCFIKTRCYLLNNVRKNNKKPSQVFWSSLFVCFSKQEAIYLLKSISNESSCN